jgi:hypothetical protein
MVYVSGETSGRRFRECGTMSGPGGRLIPLPRGGHLAAMKVQAMKNEPQRTLREMEGATMTSDDSVDGLRLDRDPPITAEDVAVARRLRHGPL